MRATEPSTVDVMGLGALNVDVIVDASNAAPEVRSELRRAGIDLGLDTESRVGGDDMARLLAAVEGLPRRVALGGSAFNTVTGVAARRPDLAVGYVGVAGATPFGAASFEERLNGRGAEHGREHGGEHGHEPGKEHRSDTRALLTTSERAGVCLAVEHLGTRNMRIDPGANLRMADHLVRDFETVVACLSRARIVHVTSFLDDRTPDALLAVLRALRTTAPATRICLDPGHEWCAGGLPVVRELVAAGDYLLLNEQEFTALCPDGAVPGGDASPTAVVKRPGGATIHRPDGRPPRHVPHTPLPPHEIRHPTGAGDAFAAGLLIGLGDFLGDSRDDSRGALLDDSREESHDGLAGPPGDALAAAVRTGLAAARSHLRGRGDPR